MKTTIKKIALSITLLYALMVGCKKDEETTPASNTTTVAVNTENLSLTFEPYVGSTPLNYSSAYTTHTGEKFTISMFRYYVSNIRLIKSDGSEYPIAGKYLMVTPTTANYSLGKVPLGNYQGLKFDLGLDSATNHSDPTVYPASNPLAIQSPGIHWSWSSGYIFMMIEGSCDTTSSNTDTLASGQYARGMFFHIGMDKNKKEVDLNTSSFTVSSSEEKVINIKADLNTFFTNINLKTDNQTHTMDNMMLANKAVANIPGMFSVIP